MRVTHSARVRYSDSWAQRGDFAARAPRRRRMTNRLAECDQDSVVLEPMPRGQHSAQRNLRLVGRLGAHQAPSIRNTMHMSIDADTRLRVRLGHDQVRGLAPDAFERQQRVDLVRHASVEFVDQVAAYPADNDK